MIDALTSTFGLYLGTFAVCLVGGLLPLVNADFYLLGLSGWAVFSPAQIPLIVALAAVGQMIPKVPMYYGTLAALDSPKLDKVGTKRHAMLVRWRARIERWHTKRYWMLGAAASIAIPPFYIIGILAGVLRIPPRNFIVIGLVGRVVRFTVIMVLPVREIAHALGSVVGC